MNSAELRRPYGST